MFAHLEKPVTVECEVRGLMTFFAREGDDVHVLLAHEGTITIPLAEAKHLIRDNNKESNLTAEQAVKLGFLGE